MYFCWVCVSEKNTSVGNTKIHCEPSLAFIMYLKEKELSFYLISLEHSPEHEEVQSVSPLFSECAEDVQVLTFRKEVSTGCPECTIGWVIFSIFLLSVLSSWLTRWQLHVKCSPWLIDFRHSSPTQPLPHQGNQGKNQRSKSEIPGHTQYFLFVAHNIMDILYTIKEALV